MKKIIIALLLCTAFVSCGREEKPIHEQSINKQTIEHLEHTQKEQEESIKQIDLDNYKYFRESYLKMDEGQLKDNFYKIIVEMWSKDYIREYEESLEDSML